jgi:nitrogen PTS system EIIA component
MSSSDQAPRLLLSQWITPATIELKMHATQRDEALEELVSKIPDIQNVPESRRTLLRALQERELLCSTGIGDGIALPHSRNALVGLVDKPVIVFGRHPLGIPFGSVDGIPARLFFLLVAPTVSQHLQVLARLSRILRDPTVRQGLLTAERPERVQTVMRDAEANL